MRATLPDDRNALEYFRERITPDVQLWFAGERPPLIGLEGREDLREVDFEKILQTIQKAVNSDKPSTISITSQTSLVITPIAPNRSRTGAWLLAPLPGDPKVASALVRNTIEGWNLRIQNADAQSALNDSAMQLAQSYEEQNWLRHFARNATTFSKVTSANEVASVILQPLGYLSRAQGVFLIVDPEESERSGLVSASFGDSSFSIRTVTQVLNSYQFGKRSTPLVRNNIALHTPEGRIESLVSVVVANAKSNRGFLVAVNRSQELGALTGNRNGEFGSNDVSLLEDAAALLSTQADNMHLLLQSNELFMGTLRAMSSTIDARDPYTQGHSERVARLSHDLAEILGLPDQACHEIYLSGILHDIGKIGIPDSVLLKPGKLTDEEFDVIKQHPTIGHRIVKRLGQLEFTLPGVLHHHERWDGNGYPHGLRGNSIPLMARIMAVADAFDAMTSCRPYRKAMPTEKACSILYGGAGEQWDAEIVECFKKWISTQDIAAVADEETNSIIPLAAPLEQLSQAVMSLLS